MIKKNFILHISHFTQIKKTCEKEQTGEKKLNNENPCFSYLTG